MFGLRMSKHEFWKKYGTFILYNLYGFSATLLETFLYWLFYRELGVHNVPATIISTFITITYAFFTNKIFVYKSKDWRLSALTKEIGEFYGFRIITAFFNVGYMYVTVSLLKWAPVPMKMISALIVGWMNYVLGKKVVFKKRHRFRDRPASRAEQEEIG